MFNEMFWLFSDSLTETKRKYIMKKMDGDVGEGSTVMTPDGPLSDESIRKVKVSQLGTDNELGMATSNMVSIANFRANWNYKIDFQDPFQYLTYDVGGHYVPHIDGAWDQTYEWDDQKRNMSVSEIQEGYKLGKIRKLSTVHLLNDEFEGGEFIMYRLKATENKDRIKGGPQGVEKPAVIAEELTLPLKAGDCIVFPSNIMHTVKPVTQGKRYAIVSWFGGDRIG